MGRGAGGKRKGRESCNLSARGAAAARDKKEMNVRGKQERDARDKKERYGRRIFRFSSSGACCARSAFGLVSSVKPLVMHLYNAI